MFFDVQAFEAAEVGFFKYIKYKCNRQDMYVIINWYNIVVIGCSLVSSGSQVDSDWDPL